MVGPITTRGLGHSAALWAAIVTTLGVVIAAWIDTRQSAVQAAKEARPDPYTGSQGRKVEKQADHIEEEVKALKTAFSMFMQKGPAQINQKLDRNLDIATRKLDRNFLVLQDIRNMMVTFSIEEKAVRKSHEEFGEDMKFLRNFATEESGSDERFHREMNRLRATQESNRDLLKDLAKEVKK